VCVALKTVVGNHEQVQYELGRTLVHGAWTRHMSPVLRWKCTKDANLKFVQSLWSRYPTVRHCDYRSFKVVRELAAARCNVAINPFTLRLGHASQTASLLSDLLVSLCYFLLSV
jgi:hypothetical protein